MEKISIEDQRRRLSESIKLLLQIIGFLGVISSIIYAGAEFYHRTLQNDDDIKKEMLTKTGEIQLLDISLKENFKEHKEIKDKITEMHTDIKMIRVLLEIKERREKKEKEKMEKKEKEGLAYQ